MQKAPLILTLKLDENSQLYLNMQRKLNFPPDRDFLDAHLTIFHQLPDVPDTFIFLENLEFASFCFEVSTLLNLGAGVAYKVNSEELIQLRRRLVDHFSGVLIPQDKQLYRPHITIMNKSTPDLARQLLSDLSAAIKPFQIQAIGLELWTYMNGPWRHRRSFKFKELLA